MQPKPNRLPTFLRTQFPHTDLRIVAGVFKSNATVPSYCSLILLSSLYFYFECDTIIIFPSVALGQNSFSPQPFVSLTESAADLPTGEWFSLPEVYQHPRILLTSSQECLPRCQKVKTAQESHKLKLNKK